jgi:MFS family permease
MGEGSPAWDEKARHTSRRTSRTVRTTSLSVPRIAVMAAAGFAVAMGLGRFAFTPILPLMTDQADLSLAGGAHLATANYLGYLLGPVLTLILPRVVSSRNLYRASLVVIVMSLLGMSLTTSEPLWLVLRFLAGAASALMVVMIASSAAYHCRAVARHVVGWIYGGIGVGIALSGVLILALGAGGSWRHAWWVVALASLILAAPAWFLPLHPATPRNRAATHEGRTHPQEHEQLRQQKRWGVRKRLRDRVVRGFSPLVVSYFLEGVGYIIAGTFLVTAVAASSPGWVGNSTWILVGLAAAPSSALYGALSHRISAPTLLASALALQALGMALPAVLPGALPALIAGACFGATFQGITTLTMTIGTTSGVPHAVSILTIMFSIGQVVGPLLAAPLLTSGYSAALLLGAAIVACAAATAVLTRLRTPIKSTARSTRHALNPTS